MQAPHVTIDRRLFAAVRRTAVYRVVAQAWDRPVVLACSGGTDSMALLLTAAVARDAGRVAPFIVAHVDHHVREGSADEGRLVAAVAYAANTPFVQLRIEPDASDDGGGQEARLRALRYAALAGLAQRVGVERIVTAHTQDDQIETILLRLISGAGALASAGMRPVQHLETAAGPVVVQRPLLGIGRSDLVQVLAQLGIQPIEDPSNFDLAYRRNRIRQRVVPELEQVDPGFGDALIRAAGHAARDAQLADRLAREIYTRDVGQAEGRRTIPRSLLSELDLALASRVVRQAMHDLVCDDTREITQERIMAVVTAGRGRSGTIIELPYGLMASIGRDATVIAACDGGRSK